MLASNRCSSDRRKAVLLAERFLEGIDAGLPFRACFFADMTNGLLHLAQPTPDLTPPLADRRMARLGGDAAEVPLDLGEELVQPLQSAFPADPHLS
jgi:hypothetical protein